MEEALAGRRVIHPDLGDNICFKREHDTGGVDAAFANADVVVEETYEFGRHTGVDARAALHPRRLQRRRARAHRLSLDAGAAHDAGHLLAAPRHPRRQRARDREGRGRLLRHQGARLRRRDGDRRAVGHAAPAGQVHRRPAGIVRDRHPRARAQGDGAARVHESGRDPRVRARRPDRDRPLLGLPAHQRHRGQPGGEPDRRPLQAPAVPREAERRVHQQERDLPVPRGRPPDRGRADRGHRRSRRRRSSAWTRRSSAART